MERLKYFLRTTFFGGVLVILPIFLLAMVLGWLFNFVSELIEPITQIIVQTARLHYIFSSIIAVILILVVCFLVGLLIRTKIGNFTYKFFEDNFLKRIPFYKIIKETVIQLFGNQKTLFSSVALVNLFGNGNLVTAFVTDEHDNGYSTVFVPSGPAPTAGFVYHVKNEFIQKIDYPLDQSMRTIISLGAGSKPLLEKVNNPNKKI
jgi:uncharacterized membrane protein